MIKHSALYRAVWQKDRQKVVAVSAHYFGYTVQFLWKLLGFCRSGGKSHSLLFLLAFGLVACRPAAVALPTRVSTATLLPSPTHTASPTATPTATATFTPTPTFTPTATATATPTATSTATPTSTPSATPTPTATATPTSAPSPTTAPTAIVESITPSPTLPPTSIPPTSTPSHNLILQPAPGLNGYPSLRDFWEGTAQFVMDVDDTGLPMGESDTLLMRDGTVWAYLHASAPSAGTVDRCGDPVPFPGCTVIYRSSDGGRSFYHDEPPVCQFECHACPCESETDHVNQQQYPRLAYNGHTLFLVYEYLGRTRLRRSIDGLVWSSPEKVADTGIWNLWLRSCRDEERIHEHPYVPYQYECLAGAPPGIVVVGGKVYIFVGMGQNPGSMGCFVGSITTPAEQFVRCQHNPLFVGATEYGPLEDKGAHTNPHFDFRTISSAEVQLIGDRYYMLYEGVRGPGPGDGGDTQFALGLARSTTSQVDGPWEKFPNNPILVALPGNVGLGHADLLVWQGQTVLFTSLNGVTRSRLVLVWK